MIKIGEKFERKFVAVLAVGIFVMSMFVGAMPAIGNDEFSNVNVEPQSIPIITITSQEENETSQTVGVGILEEETNGTTVTITSQEENETSQTVGVGILEDEAKGTTIFGNTSRPENLKIENQSITTCPYQSNNSKDVNASFDESNGRNTSIPLGTITIQPGPSDGKDALIYQKWPDSNYGSYDQLRVGCYDNEYDYVSFLQFSLSSIPTGATINSATLSLYCAQTWGSAQYIRLYQLYTILLHFYIILIQ